MHPFQPLAVCSFHMLFSIFFLTQHSLQSAAKIKAKGQFKLLRPTQLGAISPYPLFSAYAATGRLRHRLQRQVPRYIARHWEYECHLDFFFFFYMWLLAQGESSLGLAPSLSSPLH